MEKYLLTIAIPTYNRAFWLKGLLENIFFELTDSKLEGEVQVLVVDGKSDDDTPEIVKDWQSRVGIKYYRRTKRVGIDKDILKCVELAEGKYCWLFSDDDRITPGAIGYLINILKGEADLIGCFCNRISYDFPMAKKVAEVSRWPGQIFIKDHLFINKDECFKYIGMDFGFISSQVIRRSRWQQVVEGADYGDLYHSYYLMVNIIGKMMDKDFKWLYIHRPLVKQRTGNDSLLKNKGIYERQIIEHDSFAKIVSLHYDSESEEFKIFFNKMVTRLPRVIANLKSQKISYLTQLKLFSLFYSKYRSYPLFWIKVAPMFFLPNMLCKAIKKIYFNYMI